MAHGWRWTGDRRPPFAEDPGPGQRSVWDFPRPPRLEEVGERVVVEHGGVALAESDRAVRALETAGAPTYYLPPDDVRTELLRPTASVSVCEWKGTAAYLDVVVGDEVIPKAAWCYPTPRPAFAAIAGWLSFYAGKVDSCRVGGEEVRPQPGGFYGGWVTSDLAGPIKGEPGSGSW